MLAVAAVLACGVKGPPLPADLLLPEAVTNLAYRFREDGALVLSFMPPTKNVNKVPLRDLGGFFVDRSENRIDPDFCPGCPVIYTKRFKIRAVPPPPRKHVAEIKYEFVDHPTPGYVYSYRIFAHDSDGDYRPQKFQTLVVYYDSPSRPPDAIETRIEDRVVFLSWSPPDRLLSGQPATDVIGYNVYRVWGEAPWTRINTAEPWGQTGYKDTQVVNGRTYTYKIRTVREFHGTLIEGPPSPPVSATPVDLTPPPSPVKVEAVPLANGVTLSWGEVTASDLAGYRVYRREESETEFKRLGPPLISARTFFDPAVSSGHIYFYYVTAVDNSPAANESGPSREVQVHFKP